MLCNCLEVGRMSALNCRHGGTNKIVKGEHLLSISGLIILTSCSRSECSGKVHMNGMQPPGEGMS